MVYLPIDPEDGWESVEDGAGALPNPGLGLSVVEFTAISVWMSGVSDRSRKR